MSSYIETLARQAYVASTKAALMPTFQKNDLLLKIADAIESHYTDVLAANQKDVDGAVNRSLPKALVDRLALNPARFTEMVMGIRKVAALQDPVGRIIDGYSVESTLNIRKKTVPFVRQDLMLRQILQLYV